MRVSESAGWTIESGSEQETLDAGKRLAERLPPGSTVCLEGDLGTGKTVFARGFAAGLGIAGPVTSPTFTLVNSYEGRAADGSARTLHHFDLYRIDDPEELFGIGWDEYFDGEAVCLVEWPERAGALLPDDCCHVGIRRGPAHPEHRIITVGKEGRGA